MEPGEDPRYISAYDSLEVAMDRPSDRVLSKRPSDPNIEIPDAEPIGSKKHDSKSTPQWVPSNSPSSYGILIHGEAVLQQQREFATLQNQSPSSVTSSHSGLSASGRNSPASFDSFAPGSHEPAVERRTTRPRNRSRSRSGKESSGRSAGRWTADEEEKLRDGHDQFGDDWQAISMHCFGGREGRTAEQCQARWEKVLERGLVKGPWKEEEDEIILRCIAEGMQKWSDIAKHVPGRVGKQCRERWHNHLDPSLKKTAWEEEEDAILIHAQRKWGNLWTKIARLIPGRSENQVKNRWHAATRRRPASAGDSDGYSSSREADPGTRKATPLCSRMLQMLDSQNQNPRQSSQDRGSVNTTSLLLVDIDFDEAYDILSAARETVMQNRLRIPAAVEGSPSTSQSRRMPHSRDPSPSIDESELPPPLTMTATGVHSSGKSRLQEKRPPQLSRPNSSSGYSASPSPTASSRSSYSYSSDHSPEARDDDEYDLVLPLQAVTLNSAPMAIHAAPQLSAYPSDDAIRLGRSPGHAVAADRDPYFPSQFDNYHGNRSASWPTTAPQFVDDLAIPQQQPQQPQQPQQQFASDLNWSRLVDTAQLAAAHPHHPGTHAQPVHYDMRPFGHEVFNGGMSTHPTAFPFQPQRQPQQPHPLHQQAYQQPLPQQQLQHGYYAQMQQGPGHDVQPYPSQPRSTGQPNPVPFTSPSVFGEEDFNPLADPYEADPLTFFDQDTLFGDNTFSQDL